jgi:hypothetical protein
VSAFNKIANSFNDELQCIDGIFAIMSFNIKEKIDLIKIFLIIFFEKNMFLLKLIRNNFLHVK